MVFATDIREISMSCGPCFGTCPVFDVKLTRDGHNFRYEGHRYTEPLGLKTGKFPEHLFKKISEICIDLDILSLDDVYPSDLEDTPQTRYTIRYSNQIKTIVDEGDGKAPTRLWAFGVLIENVVRTAFSIEDRKRLTRG